MSDPTPATRETIGYRIRMAREYANLSQSETARRMNDAGHPGWTQMTAARTERGERTIGAVELLDLAVILGTTYTEVLAATSADRASYRDGYRAGQRDALNSLQLAIRHQLEALR